MNYGAGSPTVRTQCAELTQKRGNDASTSFLFLHPANKCRHFTPTAPRGTARL